MIATLLPKLSVLSVALAFAALGPTSRPLLAQGAAELRVEGLRVLSVDTLVAPAAGNAPAPVIVLLDDGSRPETHVDSTRRAYASDGYAVLGVGSKPLEASDAADLSHDVLQIRRRISDQGAGLSLDRERVYFLPVDAELARDVDFFHARGYAYRMDVRAPINSPTAVPLVLQIAHKDDCRRCHASYARYGDGLLDALALLGYATAYADHYGAGFHDYDKVDWMPQAVHPAKAAVQYLKRRAADYAIDTSRIVALGFSKGATAAAMLATTADEPALEVGSTVEQPGSSVAAAIAIGAYLDLPTLLEDADGRLDDRWTSPLAQWGPPDERPEQWRASSVTTYASPADAPLLLIAGGDDSYRPRQMARLVERLERAGVPHEAVVVPGLGHRLPADRETFATILAFLNRYAGEPDGHR